MNVWLALLIGFIAGNCFGWVRVHSTVAQECTKLGAFYVGDKVFRCVEVDTIGDQEKTQ